MSFRYYLGLIILFVAGLTFFLLSPQTSAPREQLPPIAVVDLNKIIADLKSMQGFKDNLNKSLQKYQKEFQEKENKLRAEYQALLDKERSFKERDPQTSRLLEQERKAFQEKTLKTQKEAEAYQARLNDFHHQSLEKFHVAIEEKIQYFAKKRKLRLLLPKDKTLYVEPYIDLTDDLAAELSSVELPTFAEGKR